MSRETLGAEEEKKKNQRLSVNEEEQREARVCYDSFIVSGVDTRNDDTDRLDTHSGKLTTRWHWWWRGESLSELKLQRRSCYARLKHIVLLPQKKKLLLSASFLVFPHRSPRRLVLFLLLWVLLTVGKENQQYVFLCVILLHFLLQWNVLAPPAAHVQPVESLRWR